MMNRYLLTLLSDQQPRRIRVIENVLKNKRTVANLFWGRTYGILPWLGAAPHLVRADYEQQLRELRAQHWLTSDPEMLQLTPAGKQEQHSFMAHHYQPYFFDWYWVTNPGRLERRTLLAIQALSELAANNQRYAPLTAALDDTNAVRRWLLSSDRRLIRRAEGECLQFGQFLAERDERLAQVFASEMIGHQISGVPAQREAAILQIHENELTIMRRDVWLAFGGWCLKRINCFSTLVKPLLNASPLSRSARQTLVAYNQGQSISTIVARRRLKVSTVREHLIAAAILTPKAVDWDRLLPAQQRQKLASRYHGPVTDWQFAHAGQNDSAGFFYFRLFQIWEELANESTTA